MWEEEKTLEIKYLQQQKANSDKILKIICTKLSNKDKTNKTLSLAKTKKKLKL